MRQYKTASQLGLSKEYLENWRGETDAVVALAIHAIADGNRTPEQIWEAPTQAEYDHVVAAVQQYINGDEYHECCDVYHWGEEKIRLPE